MELHSETFNPADFAWRGLTLTPAAAAHIHELVAKNPDILGVRLGVKQTGCAGFGYVRAHPLRFGFFTPYERRRTGC